jgi:hypothetical protein
MEKKLYNAAVGLFIAVVGMYILAGIIKRLQI